MRYIALLIAMLALVGCATKQKSTTPMPSTAGIESTSAEISSAVSSAIVTNKDASKLIDEAIKLNLKAQKSIK